MRSSPSPASGSSSRWSSRGRRPSSDRRSEPTLRAAIGIVALGCTYPFLTGLWPLRRWLGFLGAAAIIFVAISVVGFLALLPIGGVPTDSMASKLLQFGVTVGSLAGAAVASVLGDRW